MGPDRDVLFFHIPKASGTSLNKFLERVRPGAFVRFRELDAQALDVLLADKRPKAFSAHPPGGFELWRSVLDSGRDFFRLTFLRHPLERFLSHYFFNHQVLEARGIGLAQVFERPLVEHGLCPNHQVQILSALGRPRDYSRPASRQDLEQAKRNLVGLDFFGLTEQFEPSCMLLAGLLGADPALAKGLQENANPSRPARDALDERIILAVEGNNLLDFELYDFACGLFLARVEAWKNRAQRAGRRQD